MIDSDTSNPDVARACGAGMKDEDAKAAKGRAAAVRTLPLDFLDGWAELVDCAKKYPEAVLVVNAGARGQLVSDPGAQRVWGVADAAEHGILAKLKEAGRPFPPSVGNRRRAGQHLAAETVSGGGGRRRC